MKTSKFLLCLNFALATEYLTDQLHNSNSQYVSELEACNTFLGKSDVSNLPPDIQRSVHQAIEIIEKQTGVPLFTGKINAVTPFVLNSELSQKKIDYEDRIREAEKLIEQSKALISQLDQLILDNGVSINRNPQTLELKKYKQEVKYLLKRQKSVLSKLEEKKIISQCMKTIGYAGGTGVYLTDESISTIVHEIGHNLGLLHIDTERKNSLVQEIQENGCNFGAIQKHFRKVCGDNVMCSVEIEETRQDSFTRQQVESIHNNYASCMAQYSF